MLCCNVVHVLCMVLDQLYSFKLICLFVLSFEVGVQCAGLVAKRNEVFLEVLQANDLIAKDMPKH